MRLEVSLGSGEYLDSKTSRTLFSVLYQLRAREAVSTVREMENRGRDTQIPEFVSENFQNHLAPLLEAAFEPSWLEKEN